MQNYIKLYPVSQPCNTDTLFYKINYIKQFIYIKLGSVLVVDGPCLYYSLDANVTIQLYM